MSEAKNQSAKMELEPAKNVGVPITQDEGGSNGEFVVHTKHTCDICFQSPILGKRYTSSVHPNYDICARCFGAYSGPEIDLKEAVLIRDKKHSREFVLKLKINNGGDEQVRRIKLTDIWGKSSSRLSFGKMISVASRNAYSGITVDDAQVAAFIAKATATYIDADGDKITFSTDKELEDAFLQTLKKFPLLKPFRITVTIPKDGPATRYGARCLPSQRVPVRQRVSPRGLNSFRDLTLKLLARISSFMPGTRVMVAPSLLSLEPATMPRRSQTSIYAGPVSRNTKVKTSISSQRLPSARVPLRILPIFLVLFIIDRDRRMQRRWLKKQLNSPEMASNIAGMWNKANGDLSDFLKKVQESGGSIESATVYACPPAKDVSASELKNPGEQPIAEKAPVDAVDDLKEPPEPVENVHAASNKCPSETKPETPTDEEAPGSPASNDESFLSDADGNGSIAEAIGRTLDVCVAAIEDAMEDEMKKFDAVSADNKETPQRAYDSKLDDGVAAAAAVAADAFSVASSMLSSGLTDIVKQVDLTDIVKQVDGATKKSNDASQSIVSQQPNDAGDAASTNVPSVVTGATILKSEDGVEKRGEGAKAEVPKVEDASDEEDEWSVIDDDNVQAKHKATLFDWDSGDEEKSVSSALSPVVLAKYDTELHQLHELGFLDDRKNVDVLESLEASHVAVDSTEKVTINAAIGRLLGERG
ncbi:hypothetical protein ACHAXR_012759 [Thalassiosira sp. AJA248-18]